MALIVTDNKKQYEKPESGAYNAVLVDTADLGVVATKFGNKNKVRFIWVLGKLDGSGYAVDTEGNPFRVMSEMNATTNEKSDLFKTIQGILGVAPPAGAYDVEQLIGRNNQLFIVREKSKDGQKEYANVKGILPYPPTLAPLPIPQGFVRHKDRDLNKDTRNQTGNLSTPASQQGQAQIAAGIQGQAGIGQPVAAPAAVAPAPAPVGF